MSSAKQNFGTLQQTDSLHSFNAYLQDTWSLTLTKMTKIRSVCSSPPGCRTAYRLRDRPTDQTGPTAGCGGDPRSASRFITTSKGEPRTSVCAAAHRPHPPTSFHPPAKRAATPPRPPPRPTSKTASASPALIWDKWDLCSTKGA